MSWKVLDGYARCGLSGDGQKVRWNSSTGEVEVNYYASWNYAGNASNESEAMSIANIWLSDKR